MKGAVDMKSKELPRRRLHLRWATVGVVSAAVLFCRMLPSVLALPLGGLFLVLFRRSRRERPQNWSVLGAALFLLWLGVYSSVVCLPITQYYGETRELSLLVTDYHDRDGSAVEVAYRPALGLPVTGYLYINVGSTLRPGDRLTLTGRICDPTQPDSTTPHSYQSEGVFFLVRNAKLTSLRRCEQIPLRFWHKTAARRLNQQISALFSEEEGPFFLALLMGDTGQLPALRLYQLNRLGIRHIIAVSGLHVGFLVLLFLRLPLSAQVRQLLCVPVLVAFCTVVGGRASVVRAVVMTGCLLLAPFFRRDSDSWAALRLALFLLLLRNPFSIENVGLQLSFLSVTGILLFSSSAQRFLDQHLPQPRSKLMKSLKRWICTSLAFTFGAAVFTLPLSAYYFGTISLAAPVTNLLTLWAVELGYCFAVLAVAVSFVLPMAGAVLAVPARLFLGYVLFTADLLSDLFFFAAITTDVLLYVGYFAALYLAGARAYFLEKKRKRLKRLIIALVVSFPLLLPLHRSNLLSGGLAVQILDVGQGQCILCLSGADAVAVDCGGWNAGERLARHMEDVCEFELNYLMLTHLDDDHVSGLPFLLELVQVDTVLVPPCSQEERAALTELLQPYGTQLRTVDRDTAFSFGTARLECFAPVEEDTSNDSGLSARIRQEEYAVLVTGDMDTKAEERLLVGHDLRANVLIVGHHGSKYSTGTPLLEAVQPETAIISVGKGNLYGHPAPEALMRLEEAGCVIYRTDWDGTVTVKRG